MNCKYFIKSNYHDWVEVTKEQYMQAENDEGFYSKFSDHPATQSFGGKNLQGKTIYNQPERLNPEGLKKCENSLGYKFGNNYINLSPCDSPNSANK